MKIQGTHTISAPRERVFEMLTDPDALARCIPGARKLKRVDENMYELEINAGVGPIKGSYSGTVRLEDLNPPECYRMIVDAKGKTGFVKGEGSIDLAAEGEGTQVSYRGNVQLGGPVAAVGQRLHLSVSKMMTRQLLGAIEAEANAAPGETVKHGILRDYLRRKKPGAGR